MLSSKTYLQRSEEHVWPPLCKEVMTSGGYVTSHSSAGGFKLFGVLPTKDDLLTPHSAAFHSVAKPCSTSELIISLPLSAKSSYLFCCHFITGSSYQPAESHVIRLTLSQASIFLIRHHPETGSMVYSRSLMLEKVQGPGDNSLVTFWILEFFFFFFITFTKGHCHLMRLPPRPQNLTSCAFSHDQWFLLWVKGSPVISLRMSSNSDTGDAQESLKHGLTSVGKSELFFIIYLYFAVTWIHGI